MNVKDLRERLKGVPDGLEVVNPGPDHSYTPVVFATIEDAGEFPDGTLVEWFGEGEGAHEDERETVVFVIQ